MTDATTRAAMAERAARAGGEFARTRFGDPDEVETKSGPRDFVTAADREAQRRVIETVRRRFPDDTFVCEEGSRPSGVEIPIEKSVPATGTAWVVDPIDGTTNYIEGVELWATSVAAVRDDETVGVATYLPVAGDSYTAGPEGSSLNGDPIAVSNRTEQSLFEIAVLGRLHAAAAPEELFRTVSRLFGDTRRVGSVQTALALVAAGDLDGAVTPVTPHPWDTVAGVHLVRRAGGTATDIHGDRWQSDATGLVVSNGTAHDWFLEAARAGRES
jgi:myo-inositol-1(or 4)-monophosphatase